jgi:flagellar M-ring protein FliF
MRLITSLAQAAIGYNSERGDVVTIQNLGFAREVEPVEAPPTALGKIQKTIGPYETVLRYAGLLVLFGVVYLLMIRPIQKKALAAPLADLVDPMLLPEGSEDHVLKDPQVTSALRAATLKKQLSAFVAAEPENSTTAVRVWLKDSK